MIEAIYCVETNSLRFRLKNRKGHYQYYSHPFLWGITRRKDRVILQACEDVIRNWTFIDNDDRQISPFKNTNIRIMMIREGILFPGKDDEQLSEG